MNSGLKTIGALINTYESHGVSPSHLHLQAVFHGPTIVLVTDDVTYKGRTGVEHNPNVDLLNQLRKAGLKTVVLRPVGDGAALRSSIRSNMRR